jgi:hypothetical protein
MFFYPRRQRDFFTRSSVKLHKGNGRPNFYGLEVFTLCNNDDDVMIIIKVLVVQLIASRLWKRGNVESCTASNTKVGDTRGGPWLVVGESDVRRTS